MHSGISGLVEMVYNPPPNGHVLIILDNATTAMTGHFKRGEFTDGLLHGINRAGELLAAHFPHEPDDRNELPDAVLEDGREP